MGLPDLSAVRGFANLRDVGGLAAGDATVVPGVLLRSDAPGTLDDDALTTLRAAGLRYVLDLRNIEEAAHHPTPFTAAGFTVTSLPIFTGSIRSFTAVGTSMRGMYAVMATECGTALTTAVRHIAVPTMSDDDGRADAASPVAGGVLVHCTAGKDRTGLTVALALRAVGVSRDDVIANYAETEARLRGPWLAEKLEQLRRVVGEDAESYTDMLVTSPADVLDEFLTTVEDGSPEATRPYLRAHGMNDDEIATLVRRLLG
ncbi:tyrosine-protein phosphatase [Sanguibacter sp. A247]